MKEDRLNLGVSNVYILDGPVRGGAAIGGRRFRRLEVSGDTV